ncbi:MAG: restriction endonuclease subunit S [Prevotella sp.]|nr:restriction endonuclease subunit S [Prevotella sp.]
MTNPQTYKRIPALRFPEFINDGEWEVKRLGEIIVTISPPKKLQSNEYQKVGKYPIVDQSKDYICGYSNDESALLNMSSEEMIVFGDHTCILKFVDFPFIQGADGIKIIKSLNSDKWNERYIYQHLLFAPIVSTEYKRHFAELKEKVLYFPKSIEEQKRIAECLSSMDEMIVECNNKLEQLKSHKKGLMQQLFVPLNGGG